MDAQTTKKTVIIIGITTFLLIFIIAYWNNITASRPSYPEDQYIGLR